VSLRAQTCLALGLLVALAITERWWRPLWPVPSYWLNVGVGWLSGWMVRGIVERNRRFRASCAGGKTGSHAVTRCRSPEGPP
jgi:hypothetical protein